MKRILNIKTFIILVIMCAVGIILIGEFIERQRYNELEKKKEKIEDNPFMAYVSGDIYSFDDVIDKCGWEYEEFTGVTFAVEHTGDGKCKYYFEDRELIDEVLDKLQNMKIYEQNGTMSGSDAGTIGWQCYLIHKDMEKECSLAVNSNITTADGIETIDLYTTPSNDPGTSLSDCPLADFMPKGALIFDEDMVEFWLDVFERYVNKIDVNLLVEWNGKGRDNVTLKDYFIYEHLPHKGRTYTNDDGEEISGHMFEFPIEGTECYLQLEKYNQVDAFEEGDIVYHDIVSVKIYNADGDCIDLYDVDESELREFVK